MEKTMEWSQEQQQRPTPRTRRRSAVTIQVASVTLLCGAAVMLFGSNSTSNKVTRSDMVRLLKKVEKIKPGRKLQTEWLQSHLEVNPEPSKHNQVRPAVPDPNSLDLPKPNRPRPRLKPSLDIIDTLPLLPFLSSAACLAFSAAFSWAVCAATAFSNYLGRFANIRGLFFVSLARRLCRQPRLLISYEPCFFPGPALRSRSEIMTDSTDALFAASFLCLAPPRAPLHHLPWRPSCRSCSRSSSASIGAASSAAEPQKQADISSVSSSKTSNGYGVRATMLTQFFTAPT